MKSKVLLSTLIISALIIIQGCAYMHVQRPLDSNFDKTSLGTKVGRSHMQSALWLFSWGDAGTKAAADDGGIKTITHADSQYKMILFGIYTKTTTVVYGD